MELLRSFKVSSVIGVGVGVVTFALSFFWRADQEKSTSLFGPGTGGLFLGSPARRWQAPVSTKAARKKTVRPSSVEDSSDRFPSHNWKALKAEIRAGQ